MQSASGAVRSNGISRFWRRAESRHRAWRYRDRIDPGEIRWMRGYLQAGSTVVDAGAYKGGYTYWMRRHVGDSGQVVSFEPQPALAAFLHRMVDAFGWTNVQVEEAALSVARGEGTLHSPKEGPTQCASLSDLRGQDAAHSYGVRVDSLDEFLERRGGNSRVAFIKCDVEGHELDMLRGAARTLEKDRPHVLFECESRHLADHAVDDVFRYLQDLGFAGSFFWHGDRRDLSEFELTEHQVEGQAPYANNFLFEPV